MIGKAAESAIHQVVLVSVIGNLISLSTSLGIREIMGRKVQQEKLGKVNAGSRIILLCQISFQPADGCKCPAGIIVPLVPDIGQILCDIFRIFVIRQFQLACFRDRVDRIAARVFTRLRLSSDFLKGDLGNLIFVFRSGRGFLLTDIRGGGYGCRGFILLVWGEI